MPGTRVCYLDKAREDLQHYISDSWQWLAIVVLGSLPSATTCHPFHFSCCCCWWWWWCGGGSVWLCVTSFNIPNFQVGYTPQCFPAKKPALIMYCVLSQHSGLTNLIHGGKSSSAGRLCAEVEAIDILSVNLGPDGKYITLPIITS